MVGSVVSGGVDSWVVSDGVTSIVSGGVVS